MNKILWTSKDIACSVSGKESEDFNIYGISIDTRTLKKGDLFVPLVHVRDGHEFIDEAIKKGAGGELYQLNKTLIKPLLLKIVLMLYAISERLHWSVLNHS